MVYLKLHFSPQELLTLCGRGRVCNANISMPSKSVTSLESLLRYHGSQYILDLRFSAANSVNSFLPQSLPKVQS